MPLTKGSRFMIVRKLSCTAGKNVGKFHLLGQYEVVSHFIQSTSQNGDVDRDEYSFVSCFWDNISTIREEVDSNLPTFRALQQL